MLELQGKFGTAKVFTDVVDNESISQVINLLNQPYIEGSKVRMMPDIHAGAGCTIGTTMTIKDKICPNLVGVDIGCGMETIRIKAKDHTLGRFVAIKVLKPEFSEDVNFVTKFRTEAQSAAGLEHPNIVNIYDVGSENGMHYIVMEYVEGITLKTYIEKKGQLTFKEAVSIAIQVGRGIEAAHNKGIIHRDIKPQSDYPTSLIMRSGSVPSIP